MNSVLIYALAPVRCYIIARSTCYMHAPILMFTLLILPLCMTWVFVVFSFLRRNGIYFSFWCFPATSIMKWRELFIREQISKLCVQLFGCQQAEVSRCQIQNCNMCLRCACLQRKEASASYLILPKADNLAMNCLNPNQMYSQVPVLLVKKTRAHQYIKNVNK